MWLSDLTQLPGLVRDLIALQQETNLLLRELIAAQTGKRAEALRTRLSMDPHRPRLTASAVTRHSREDWARIQDQERARTTAPWRDPAVPLTENTLFETEPPVPLTPQPTPAPLEPFRLGSTGGSSSSQSQSGGPSPGTRSPGRPLDPGGAR